MQTGHNQDSFSCVNLISTGQYVTPNKVLTDDIVQCIKSRLSDELLASISKLGVTARHSVIDNYCDYLAGHCDRKLISSTTLMAVNAVRDCFERMPATSKQIGMIMTITNTANRPLPCFGYEVIGALEGDIPHDVNVINMQNQGCAAQIKAFDIASDYLKLHPNKLALLVVSEAHTAFADQLIRDKYYGLRELVKIKDKNEFAATQHLIEICLFGDGATAFLLSADQDGQFKIGPFTHLTNIDPADSDLLTMNEGGALTPVYSGFPAYVMNRNVPARGTVYASKCVDDLFNKFSLSLSAPDKADHYLIHTGSKLILDKLCDTINVKRDDERVKISYSILEKYGNLSSCSIAFMLHDSFQKKITGKSLLISFGVGFSSSVCIAES
jgi:predicted naringenin-chalcone synthase